MADVEISSSVQRKPIWLHGDLDLTIVEALRLPNMDLATEHLSRCFAACTGPCRTQTSSSDKRIVHHRKIITSDPYVSVSVPGSTVARTRVIPNAQNPIWNERFYIPLAHQVTDLELHIKDDDLLGAQEIGCVMVPAERILSGEVIDESFPIKGTKKPAELKLRMQFVRIEDNSLYRHGIAGDPEHLGVRNTYFPLRTGGAVKLYQDAHVKPGLLPDIHVEVGNGKDIYQHGSCWEDICYAISEAHHLIYIVGWSIFHKIKLVREPTRPLPRGGDLTLGELLKYKSQEGVRVLMLVWDDKTSHNKFFIKTQGVMATHDEDVKKFFKHSSVTCVLAPRYGSSKLSFFKQQVVGNLFTHHQKCVLVDTQASGNNRKITAFIGGIDLCDGRYDTPEHRLFRDLETVFQGDFHNPTFAAGMKAPRQPWHDLHCRIDGPASYDVLINFHQRWRKSTKWKEFGMRLKKKSYWHDDALIRIDRISWILSPPLDFSEDDDITSVPKDDPTVRVSREEDPETWHVQIFRSIDSGSLKGFPTKDIELAQAQNLVCSKNLVIDKSIQTAYVQAIRSAQHYIYIENQYFLGSSYAWPSYKDAGADHLIPMELALKIVQKIRAQERFAVYIVIPMWPEGDPKGAAVQEILFWQSQTMQMMYDVVAQELKAVNSDLHPLDYLNFYCLGNREETDQKLATENGQESANGGKVSEAHKNQRFMIYVHAKGMIVDDEYVIMGSANINQRSMAGTKDTEIAMGSYQPHHTWAKKKEHPRGQVYGYRKSLWAEHLGLLEDCFDDPESIECVKKVNEIAEENWKRFTDDNFTILQGHLLRYPVVVTADGKVEPLPGYEEFPDTGGKVLGAPSPQLPDILTT